MKNILLHGLVQTAASWDDVLANLDCRSECVCPELSELMGKDASYSALFKGFCDYCGKIPEKLNLCGLSLGGILALNYVIEYPDKVNSLVLIGAQYKMPKTMLRLQNMIFKLMPGSSFEDEDIGFEKADFVGLSKSMMNLDFSADLQQIACPVMVIVGENDNSNRKAAEKMSRKIRGCEFEVIENSGHEVNVDEPKRLAELLTQFFEKV